jgi:hypothetical protein
MKKERKRVVLAVCILIVFLFAFSFILTSNSDKGVTGFSLFRDFIFKSLVGHVSIDFGGVVKVINISSPENKTYYFNKGDNYTIDLNVSSNFDADTWWYSLYDIKHSIIVNNSIFFIPNATFNAVRWSNLLIVYANDSDNNIIASNVTFFVSVPNSAPIIYDIPNDIYVCESSFLSHYFIGQDIDEDTLYSDISPKDPFYVFPLSASSSPNASFEIFSAVLTKSDAGGINNGWQIYQEIVSISDRYNVSCCIDTKQTNITVIEINNAPDIENIGVKTVWTTGDNGTFFEQVEVEDIEDGNQDSGNLFFNITILNSTKQKVNLFNISQFGVMNYTANESHMGIYNITVCVNDTGIDNPHQGIQGNCSQDGSPLVSCDGFSLTVTDENRAPTIIDYYPSNLSSSIPGTQSLVFNVTNYDPDGTIPDTYWYVDNSSEEYDSGNLTEDFRYFFGCGVQGLHTVKVEVTDGLLNDSVEWIFDIQFVACPSAPGGGAGGGGGGGVSICQEKWICGDWQVCQNAKKSLETGSLTGADYRKIEKECRDKGWDERFCGVQFRSCYDSAYCNKTLNRPQEVMSCYFLSQPSCNDGIKNCHHGGCELLIDCGGPCPACPTCSDNIQNQGEEGIDCGGPCPWECPVEKPLVERYEFKYFLIFLILALVILIIVIIKLRRIFTLKKEIKTIR